MTIANSVGANDLNMNNQNIVSAGTISYTALNPPIPGAEGLADTLAVSNSAGGNDINMNNRNITNAGTISYTALDPPIPGAEGLADTLAVNASAGIYEYQHESTETSSLRNSCYHKSP